MEKDTIARHIKSLGEADFDAVVTLLFRSFFNLKSAIVDGPGDGGSDMRCFVTAREQRVWTSTATQVTITSKSWKKKAKVDAEKAVNVLGAIQYYFLTSLGHPSAELRKLELEILSEIGIPAVCMGANEIAGLIHDGNLLREFADVLNLRMDIPLNSRPDKQEILLHAIAGLSDEKKNFREGVYDDALLVTVFEGNGALSRSQLVKDASTLLGLTVESYQSVDRRMDSLLSKGRLILVGDNIALSARDKLDLQASAGMYVSELQSLASAQQQILADKGATNWSPANSEETAVLLSRIFVQNQLKIAEHASLPMTRLGLSRQIGSPKVELQALIRRAGLDSLAAEEAMQEFVALGSNRPLIQKLTRGVTYLATEGRSIAQACRALGASRWPDVFVTLDASVAIPFLCSSLFEPTEGRFAIGANECLRTLKKLNARLVMPYFYVNEVAAHLLLALNTPPGDQYARAAELSKNGFVSYYYQLKNRGKRVPDSLVAFVSVFSELAVRGNGDRHEKAKSIMPDIQSRFRDYGVDFESIETFHPGSVGYQAYRKPAEESFEHFLNQSQRKRRQNLISHDVNVLAYSKKSVTELGQARMCLTWDKTMIEVASEMKDCGWVVTPNEASDLVQTSVDFSETRLTSLAHTLAKAARSPEEIGASILDRVSFISGAPFQDWEFRKAFDEFYSQVMERISREPDATTWVDNEVEEFVSAHKGHDNEREIDTPE